MTISIAHDFTLIGLDCMLRPDMCGPNASCKETDKKVGKQWNYHQCVCNPGFVGNGITCIDASDLANGDSFFPLLSRSAHQTPNFRNPQFQFPQLTLYNEILRIARNFLETREDIKISTHSFYHINLG